MRLYHFSEFRLHRLSPQNGERRHYCEDERAIGKAVVWLTDNPERAPAVERNARYRHAVEVKDNDPRLYKDESVERLKAMWKYEKQDPNACSESETVYFYEGELDVVEIIDVT